MSSLATYIRNLQSRGRYCFTTEDAVRSLGSSATAVRAALRRAKKRRLVADPYRGFHVIVPPEYQQLGCLPADQFVPDLMAHLGEPYYAALLTAAAYHGAAHQRPQIFQVMVPRARRAIECGHVPVEFIVRHDMTDTAIAERNTTRGILRIASAEATAVELAGYPDQSGGLSNVATVLAELVETISHAALEKEARRAPMAWVQRLGYLLALVEAKKHAAALDAVLRDGRPFVVALAPSLPKTRAPRDSRWAVAINIEVEPDL